MRYFDSVRMLAGSAEKPRARFQILSVGKQHSKKYGAINVTSQMLSNFKKRFDDSGEELPLDYDHGTRHGSSVDERKVAGWIEQLELKDDALFGVARLSPQAESYVRNEEYRFASAEWDEEAIDWKSGDIVGEALGAVALTNRPVWRKLEAASFVMSERLTNEDKAERADAPPDALTGGQGGASQKGGGGMTFDLSEHGGPKSADEKEAISFLLAHLGKTKVQLAASETAASKSAELSGKVVELSGQLTATQAELKAERDARKAADKERFFSQHGTRVGAEERKTLEPIYDQDGGPERCLSIINMLPVKYQSSARGSGSGPVPTQGTAEERFLAEIAKVQREDKIQSFSEASKRVALLNDSLYREYQAEQLANAEKPRGRDSRGAPTGEEV